MLRRSAETTEPKKNYLRLNEQEVTQVGMEFNEWRGAGPRGVIKSEQMVETYLDYIAGGGYYRQVARTGGMATSTAFLHTRRVSDFLFETASAHISLPQPEEFQELSQDLRFPNGETKNVILFIDGFITKIQRPDHAGDAYFCGRHGKSCDSINTQFVTDKFGRVRHVITGLSGATHDKTATEWSHQFMSYLDRLPPGVIVLGDPAYRNLHQSVCHRFIGHNLTEDQMHFNQDVTRMRQVVERTIGATQLRWRMSQLKENRLPAKGGIIFPSKCIISMAVLHNRYTNYI